MIANKGSVYTYLCDEGHCNNTGLLKPKDGASGWQFGNTISMYEDTAVIAGANSGV